MPRAAVIDLDVDTRAQLESIIRSRSMSHAVMRRAQIILGLGVRELIEKIEAFVEHHDRTCSPFSWTATADSILAKLDRLSKAICGTAC